MWKKHLFYTFLTCAVLAVLALIVLSVQYMLRRQALKITAEKISSQFFAGEKAEIDFAARKVVFTAEKSEILHKYHINGKVIFAFPVKFFENPWRAHLASVTADGVTWDLNLKEKTLNGFRREELFDEIFQQLTAIGSYNSGKIPDFITYGKLKLTNPEGKKRLVEIRSIFKSFNDNRLLGVYAGDMKVNFLYRKPTGKIIGQYQAERSDFEFFRLSFGLPELFSMTGVSTLAGQFQYDIASQKIDYIRGSSRFGMEASVKGAIFSIFGSRNGVINWEYLNSENWQIELRNAVSGRPFRSKLNYLVLSQNTMEQNALSFDGEIEFNSNSFKDIFGLELDGRTANIRHHIVGKWNMNEKSWELSRLDTQKRVPHVKIKWNDFDITFQGQSFKLSGSGAQADHFGFHYELEMANADWKDRKGNTVIAAQAKLEGDCILSLAADTLKPIATGKLSCAVADGVFGKSRFILKNAYLNFSPDRVAKNKYQFSVGELKLGIPDLQRGVIFTAPRLAGDVAEAKTLISAPSLKVTYRDIAELESKGKWSIRRTGDENLTFGSSAVRGSVGGEKVSIRKISGELKKENIFSGDFEYTLNSIVFGGNLFNADRVKGNIVYELSGAGFPVFRTLAVVPEKWTVREKNIKMFSPSSKFNIIFKDGRWDNFNCDLGQASLTFKGHEYLLLNLLLTESNRGGYSDGSITCRGVPYKFSMTYTRPQKSYAVTVKNGMAEGRGKSLNGVTGEMKFIPENRSLEGDIQYAEFKMSDSQWENGIFAFDADVKNGFELVKFNGTSAAEMAKIAFVRRNSRGENEFEVKNFPAKYIEDTLGLIPGDLSGIFNGTVVIRKGVFFDPAKIISFKLKNNIVSRLRFDSLQKYAQVGDSVEDCFAIDALKDFFAESLQLDYRSVGRYKVLNLKAVGKSTDLLPYEFDVKEKKLKKSDVALFNSEIEIMMKYILKK